MGDELTGEEAMAFCRVVQRCCVKIELRFPDGAALKAWPNDKKKPGIHVDFLRAIGKGSTGSLNAE